MMFKSKQTIKHKRPPGPSFWTFFSRRERLIDRLAMMSFIQNTYGDISHLVGVFPIYIISNPQAVGRMLQENYENYIKADLGYKGLQYALGDGLLSNPDHTSWFNMRQTLQPHYYAKSIMHQVPQINQYINTMLDNWSPFADRGKKFNINDQLLELAGNIAIGLQFGDEFLPYRSIISRYAKIANFYAGNVMQYLWWLPVPSHLTYYLAKKQMDKAVAAILAEKENVIKTHDNFLSTLFKAMDPVTGQPYPQQRLIDEIITFSVVGHETISSLFCWAFYFIAQNPEIEEKLCKEISEVLGDREATADDLIHLKYTRMVIEETMRYYPPAWIITRKAVADDELNGYFIPAGSALQIIIYNVHHHPDYWEDPEEFKPERFTMENVRKRDRYTYIPFGGGQRTCIGSHFAVITAQLVIAKVLQRYRLTLLNKKQVKPEAHVTLRPAKKIYVKAKHKVS